MTEINCPNFTETVVCEIVENYKIAQGWTQSTGQGGAFPYSVPSGWEYDTRYSDTRGATGSHGGCSDCMMTLVHLITIDPVIVDLCKGVVCDPECYGDDRYSTICDGGTCVKGILLDTDVTECGYVPPEPITDPKTSWMIGFIVVIIAWMIGLFG